MKLELATIFKPLFNQAYKDKRIIVYYGGRGGGKSYSLTYYFLIEALKNKINVCVVREIESSKNDSVFALFNRIILDNELMPYVETKSRDSIRFKNVVKSYLEAYQNIQLII